MLDLVDDFYGEVVQHMKTWSAAPPRMREIDPEPIAPPALSSTSLSSQDGAASLEEDCSQGNGHYAAQPTGVACDPVSVPART